MNTTDTLPTTAADTTPHVDVADVDGAPAADTRVRQWVVPPVDLLRRDGDLRLRLDVPGVSTAGLTVEVHDGVLTITARRADQPERGFRRAFRLPDHVDVERVAASLAHGVLTVDLPQSASSRPRTIPVRSA